jgi:hypothetical protein
MTTGFQQQQSNFGPVLKTVARPQQIGAKLKPADDRDHAVAPEKHSFKQVHISR